MKSHFAASRDDMDLKKHHSSKSTNLKIALTFFIISSTCTYVESKTIGPDLVARARLLRDLPLTRTLKANLKVGKRNQGHVTNIDVSISARSVDLDFREGIFSMNGWIALRCVKYRDIRLYFYL